MGRKVKPPAGYDFEAWSQMTQRERRRVADKLRCHRVCARLRAKRAKNDLALIRTFAEIMIGGRDLMGEWNAAIVRRREAWSKKYRAMPEVIVRRRHAAKLAARRKEYRAKYNAYRRERLKSDPLYALCERIRVRTKDAFRMHGYPKGGTTEKLIGCTYSFLRAYLEARFAGDMSWQNHGTLWHIDHIIPLASGTTRREVERLCHYTNLRPLLAVENLSKGDRVPTQQELLIA